MIQHDRRESYIPLECWQERLKCHYQLLANERTRDLPLFAIEHGLHIEETEQIGELLRESLRTGGEQIEKYWLLWVVYATELGYNYEGNEYWRSFEEKTPSWKSHHRYCLARWFRKFQSDYHGFIPTGPWAEHFSNIAWPITHAILPKYLQYQFAKALYQQRYRLDELTLLDSVAVARLFTAHTNQVTTRFEIFLQQKELTGRIVLALLNKSPQGGHTPIYPKTLKRIITDLNTVRITRQWLQEAKQTVIDRFTGIGKYEKNMLPFTGNETLSDTSLRPDIRPNILLRYLRNGRWAVALEIPSFAPLATLYPDLWTFLKRTRCRVAGAAGIKPAGWTITGKKIHNIRSWPGIDQPLLEFLDSHDTLNRLLQAECLLSSDLYWLFRISADGRQAREIRGLNVHPGVGYILVSRRELDPPNSSLFTTCKLECDGVYAIRINVPDELSSSARDQLNAVRLEAARTIRVWPAGLPCRSWDGEGQSEWLTTEKPQFGIVYDHPVQSYLICLNEKMKISINAPAPGKPVFIQLDPLPVGRHRVTITAQRWSSFDTENQSLTGYIDLKVREPEPWVPGVPAHNGLIVDLSPYDANLDNLCTNAVDISIFGPESHSVTCILSLENTSGKIIFSKNIQGISNLPVQKTTWKEQFSRFLKEHEKFGWDYLEASSGTLTIKAEDLGDYILRFDRDVAPVRWITCRRHGHVMLRLIDETGLKNEAICSLFSMDQPTTAKELKVSELLSGICPKPPGGLFSARNGIHSDDIIISSLTTGGGFQVMDINPDLADIESASKSIVYVLHALASWKKARLAGIAAEYRRCKVIDIIHRTVYAKLCGQKWAHAEATFMDNPNSAQAVRALQKRVGKNILFSAVLGREYLSFREEPERLIEWYTDLANQYKVSSDPEFSAFAVRFAFTPCTLSSLYGDQLDTLVHQVASYTELLRGARYVALRLSQSKTEQ